MSLGTVPEGFANLLTRFSRSFLLGFKVANDVKNEFAFGRRKNENAVKSYLEFFKNHLYQQL